MNSLTPYAPFHFEDQNLLQIAMPMGGIGAGCISLNGRGGLQDFAIYNKPALSARADTFATTPAAFATLHLPQQETTRLVEGPLAPEMIYDRGLNGQGYRAGGHEGLPRFETASFDGEYPFGHVNLDDPEIPLEVRVTGFNPFIPLDDVNSSLPCAILEYRLKNTGQDTVPYELGYHLSHLAQGETNKEKGLRNRAIANRGVFFSNDEAEDHVSHGSACLMSLSGDALVKGMWFRGGWFDALSVLWREVSTGSFRENAGSNDRDVEGRSGGSLLFKGQLAPGESVTHAIAIAWHFPNVEMVVGRDDPRCEGDDCCCGDDAPRGPAWRPFYVSQWKDAEAVAEYVRERYDDLRRRTERFKTALFSDSLPREAVDAISSNLAILKAPTVLRQENGNLWGWEGCFSDAGCCPGSCTHVWNYAQAFCHLFPPLERSLREQELRRSMNEQGHINFRAALPDGEPGHNFHAAADGQLGGILKLYRDWRISGDTDWMRSLYPQAKKSLDFCIGLWDPSHEGALIEPHHNTYDIEFWGPDGMCTSIYIGALSAMSSLAEALGNTEDQQFYNDLAERGARYMDTQLFNGEYYAQDVRYEGLRDQSFAQMISGDEQGSEVLELLRQEGPKYQYGSGCLSDGIIGAWMAELYGVSTPMNRENLRRNLHAIHEYNFRRDLSRHANTQRPGYALGHEAGLLLCSWPRGGKPTLPFVYSDEVWTGIEYQVASHLILEGLVDEGLEIVRAVRSRYNGRIRNPFNEYECGNFYARAMASFALLPALTGFRYDAVGQRLTLQPKLSGRPLTAFFVTATGWGTFTLSENAFSLNVEEGEVAVQQLSIYTAEGGAVYEEQPNATVTRDQPLSVSF